MGWAAPLCVFLGEMMGTCTPWGPATLALPEVWERCTFALVVFAPCCVEDASTGCTSGTFPATSWVPVVRLPAALGFGDVNSLVLATSFPSAVFLFFGNHDEYRRDTEIVDVCSLVYAVVK